MNSRNEKVSATMKTISKRMDIEYNLDLYNFFETILYNLFDTAYQQGQSSYKDGDEYQCAYDEGYKDAEFDLSVEE